MAELISTFIFSLYPPSLSTALHTLWVYSVTSLIAPGSLLTGCGPAVPSQWFWKKDAVEQNKHLKSLKTMCWFVCGTFLCISFFRNLKLYSSKQLKLIQILRVTMAIWVRKFCRTILKFCVILMKWMYFCKINVGRIVFSNLAFIVFYNLVSKYGFKK